jgi:hypothetical protein
MGCGASRQADPVATEATSTAPASFTARADVLSIEPPPPSTPDPWAAHTGRTPEEPACGSFRFAIDGKSVELPHGIAWIQRTRGKVVEHGDELGKVDFTELQLLRSAHPITCAQIQTHQADPSFVLLTVDGPPLLRKITVAEQVEVVPFGRLERVSAPPKAKGDAVEICVGEVTFAVGGGKKITVSGLARATFCGSSP